MDLVSRRARIFLGLLGGLKDAAFYQKLDHFSAVIQYFEKLKVSESTAKYANSEQKSAKI